MSFDEESNSALIGIGCISCRTKSGEEQWYNDLIFGPPLRRQTKLLGGVRTPYEGGR